MIFDEICGVIDFTIDFVLDTRNYKIDINNVDKGISEIADYLQKSKKINFSKLMELYEDDSKRVTLSFRGENESYVSCKIYTEDGSYLLYDIRLKSKDSFNDLMTKYCNL